MSVIDDYIKRIDEPDRGELIRVVDIIRDAAPDTTETIGYGMPVFRYKGKYLIGLSAFIDHMSIFPGSRPIEELGSKLDKYKTSKGTIQFTIENPLTEELIRETVSICIKYIKI